MLDVTLTGLKNATELIEEYKWKGSMDEGGN
jgi:hypothetical protein